MARCFKDLRGIGRSQTKYFLLNEQVWSNHSQKSIAVIEVFRRTIRGHNDGSVGCVKMLKLFLSFIHYKPQYQANNSVTTRAPLPALVANIALGFSLTGLYCSETAIISCCTASFFTKVTVQPPKPPPVIRDP